MKYFLLALFYVSSAWAEYDLVLKAKDKKIDLSEEEKQILEDGEISTGRYVVGGLLGTYPGLGIGHAIQGRWSSKGWIFTAGELTSGLVLVVGAAGCLDDMIESSGDDDDECDDGSEFLMITGIIGYIGFRIWEVVDVWATPPRQNKKYHKLKDYIETKEAENKPPMIKSSLELNPIMTPQKEFGMGLTYRF